MTTADDLGVKALLALQVIDRPKDGRVDLKCRTCAHATLAVGSGHHIDCQRPDPDMTGTYHGIAKGWFFYPFNFDPVWASSPCRNYQERRP